MSQLALSAVSAIPTSHASLASLQATAKRLADRCKAGDKTGAYEIVKPFCSTDDITEVMLRAGFTMGYTRDRKALLAACQTKITEACRAKVDGYGLRTVRTWQSKRDRLFVVLSLFNNYRSFLAHLPPVPADALDEFLLSYLLQLAIASTGDGLMAREARAKLRAMCCVDYDELREDAKSSPDYAGFLCERAQGVG